MSNRTYLETAQKVRRDLPAMRDGDTLTEWLVETIARCCGSVIMAHRLAAFAAGVDLSPAITCRDWRRAVEEYENEKDRGLIN